VGSFHHGSTGMGTGMVGAAGPVSRCCLVQKPAHKPTRITGRLASGDLDPLQASEAQPAC